MKDDSTALPDDGLVPDAKDSAATGPMPTGPVKRRRLIRRVLLMLAIPYLTILILMSLFENSLVYQPSVHPRGKWEPAGLKFEDVWFTSADGTKLHAWYVPHEDPRAVLLFAHGIGGNLSGRADAVDTLNRRQQMSVMIFDYRGYGRSEGSPSEAGVLADARAARAWLAERSRVSEPQIVLFGESLGGGVMVDLAARDGARALILDSTFTSLPDAAAYHYPWLPVRWLMRNRFDSISKIGGYRGPVLQMHGDADTIIPLSIGERLFAAANEPKRLVILPDHDHNDPRPPAFFQAIEKFVSELSAAAPVSR